MKKPIYFLLISACIIIAATITLRAQPGSLDNTFGTGGMVTTDFGSLADNSYSMVIQSDGKILLAGTYHNGTDQDFALARYNSDGTLDNTFDTDGKVTTDFGVGPDYGYSIALQADGKILVAGSGYIGSNSEFALVRYNSNGSLDNTFDTDGKVTTDVGVSTDVGRSVAIQSDGKILVGGAAFNSVYDFFALVRYNANGSLDNTFDADGIVITAVGPENDEAYSVAIQSDGKILVMGYTYNGTDQDFALVRYNTNGSLDNTFDTDGMVTTDFGADDFAYAAALQSDGKIVLAGKAYIGLDYDFVLARYNSDGSLDNAFDTDGKVTTDFASSPDYGASVAIQIDGKIVVAGQSFNGTNEDFALARLNSDGSLDNSFDTDGKVTTDFGGTTDDIGRSVALQSDGKILVAGNSNNGSPKDFALARYNVSPSGIAESIFASSITTYPNPTSGTLNVLVNNTLNNASIKLINVTGQTILIKQNVSGSNFSFDITEQPAGIYFLEITEGVNVARIKLVKK